MTKEQFLKAFKQEVLGYSGLGFLDHGKWHDFTFKYFRRHGDIMGERYSENVNAVLSGAAMQHTLEEVYTRLEAMLEKYEAQSKYKKKLNESQQQINKNTE